MPPLPLLQTCSMTLPPCSFFARLIVASFGLLVLMGSCAQTDDPAPGSARQEDMRPPEDMMMGGKEMDERTDQRGGDASRADALAQCSSGETRCKSAEALERCRVGGTWVEEACQSGQGCLEGACRQQQVCEEGTASCVDAKTVQVCRPGGLAYATQSCQQGLSCTLGECKSGSGTGTQCTADAQCLGGSCRCGPGEGCPATLAPAYCTARCESAADCAQNEVCLNAQVHGLAGPGGQGSHCVAKCAGACALPGQACLWVPTKKAEAKGGVGWAQACTFEGLGEMGSTCSADELCLSEECSTAFFREGSCSRRCEEGGCPGNTVCAELRRGEFWCTLPCEAGVCPLDVPRERIDVTCTMLRTLAAAQGETCVRASRAGVGTERLPSHTPQVLGKGGKVC